MRSSRAALMFGRLSADVSALRSRRTRATTHRVTSSDPFAPPQSSIAVLPEAAVGELPWFPVGTKKLVLLTFASFGLYAVYWFERQYRFQAQHNGEKIYPLARGLFSLFFARDLFRRVSMASAIPTSWSADGQSSLYIASLILGRIIDRGTANLEAGTLNGMTTILSIVLLYGMAHPIAHVQGTINTLLAEAHPGTDPNERLTGWNYLLLACGVPALLLAVFGSFAAVE